MNRKRHHTPTGGGFRLAYKEWLPECEILARANAATTVRCDKPGCGWSAHGRWEDVADLHRTHHCKAAA